MQESSKDRNIHPSDSSIAKQRDPQNDLSPLRVSPGGHVLTCVQPVGWQGGDCSLQKFHHFLVCKRHGLQAVQVALCSLLQVGNSLRFAGCSDPRIAIPSCNYLQGSNCENGPADYRRKIWFCPSRMCLQILFDEPEQLQRCRLAVKLLVTNWWDVLDTCSKMYSLQVRLFVPAMSR